MALAKATKQHIARVADSAATLQLASEEAARRLTVPVTARATERLVAKVATQEHRTPRAAMSAAARGIRETQEQLQHEFETAMREARSIAREFAARQVALEAEPLIQTAEHALVLTPSLAPAEVEAMWAEHAATSVARRFGTAAISETMRWKKSGKDAAALPRALANVADHLEPERKLHSVTQSVGAFNEAKREQWAELRADRAKTLPGIPGEKEGARGRGTAHPFDDGFRELWSAILDTKTCSVCWGHDGEMVKVGQPFREGATTPLHGHCFPPGEQVLCPDGYRAIETIAPGDVVYGGLSGLPRRVLRNNVREYDGALLRVTVDDGQMFTMTEDHPVLGAGGWVEASKLRIGDELFSQIADARIAAPQAPAAKPHNSPTEPKQASVLGVVDRSLHGRVMPAAGIDLDGNTNGWNGEVYIEAVDGHLRHNIEAVSEQSVTEYGLELAKFAQIGASFGVLRQEGRLLLRAANRRVSGLGDPAPLGFARLGHPNEHGVRAAAGNNPKPQQSLADHTAGYPEPLSDDLFRQPLDHVELQEHGFVEDQSVAAGDPARAQNPNDWGSGNAEPNSDLDEAQSLLVQRDNLVRVDSHCHSPGVMPLPAVGKIITKIERLAYSGPVYNFAVETEESYQVGPAIVHNCRCTAITVHIPAELERYLAGAELDYEALKDDIKDYMGSRKFNVGEGVRHAKSFVDEMFAKRYPSQEHSPIRGSALELTRRVNDRRAYFPNITRPLAPPLRR